MKQLTAGPEPAWTLPSGLDPRHLRDIRNLAIFTVVFFFAYKYGMTLSSQSGAPFWFPDSVLICALLIARPRIWWIYVIAPLPIRLFVAVPPGMPFWFLLLAFANDSLKALVAASLTRRALNGRELRFDVLQDFWIYLGAAVVLAPAVSGVFGAAAWVALGREFWPTWRQWFLGDALANLVCTPALVYLARDWQKLGTAKPHRYAEALVLFGALPFAAYIAYREAISNAGLIDPFGYIPLPFLVWAAVRFGPAGASCALSIMSLLSVTATSTNQLELSQPGLMDSTLSTQLFMVVLSVPVMALSVLVEQQRRTEESLRESEERFRTMADTAPMLVWASGPDKGCTFFNKGWLTFTGRSLEEELGDGWAQGVHPHDLERCLEIYSSSFVARAKFQMEYRLRRFDGEYRWVLDNGVPRFERGGIFVGYVGSCIDITDLKHAQEEALARQKLETLGVMTAGIAHDFNNLLGSILATAEIAEGEMAEGFSPVQEINRIKAVARRASDVVHELMIYSGQDKADLEPVDVSQLVEDTLELLRISISKHAAIETHLRKNLPPVLGSATQIRQIVMNLVINASEALGEKSGVIRVTTSRVAPGRNPATNMAPNMTSADYLRLRVSDSGRGMTADLKAKIFDPFFSTKFAGRGMGLAVVQGVVRDHGGVINLFSEAGRGTTFEILLPCAGEMAEEIANVVARASTHEIRSPAKTVLVVEDEVFLREAISTFLQKRGFSVMEAGDGTAAIDLIRKHDRAIDGMLLDLTLPGMSSREVFEHVRQAHPRLKVVVTSAYSKDAVDRSFDGLPVDRFIRKPFDLDDLLSAFQDDQPN